MPYRPGVGGRNWEPEVRAKGFISPQKGVTAWLCRAQPGSFMSG